MRSAAAEMWLQLGSDHFVRRVGCPLEKCLRAHHHAGDAITALCGLFVDECLLKGTWMVGCSETFQSGDLAILGQHNRSDTGEDSLPIDHHRARATLAKATAIFCSIQAEFVSQYVEKRGIRRRFNLVARAIDYDGEHDDLIVSIGLGA